MPNELENKCDRCANWYGVKRIFNIRPYNPNGIKNEKGYIEQIPIMLCKNCRERIWYWVNGETRKLDLSPDLYTRTKPLDLFLYGDN